MKINLTARHVRPTAKTWTGTTRKKDGSGTQDITCGVPKRGKPALDLFDTNTPGFGLRISYGGKRAYFVMKRLGGTLKRYTFGNTSTHTLAQARSAAKEITGNVSEGKDPDEIKREREAEAARQRADTVLSLGEQFIEEYAKTAQRRWEETERIFKVYVFPSWADKPITTIGPRVFMDLIGEIDRGKCKGPDGKMRGGRVMADRAYAMLRKFFRWFAAREETFISPVREGQREDHSGTANRVLTDAEIRALRRGLDKLPNKTAASAVWLALLLGRRKSEVNGMRWRELNEAGDEWTIPPERNKASRKKKDQRGKGVALLVPLPPLAQEIIAAQPKFADSEFVFSGRGGMPVNLGSKLLAAISKAGGLGDDWNYHALRHTAHTLMTRWGVSHFDADRALGHVIPGIGARYNHHDYVGEKSAALMILQVGIMAVLDDKDPKAAVLAWKDKQEKERRKIKLVASR